MLVSVGWAITCPRLPHRRIFLGAVAALGGLSALCELHDGSLADQPSSRLYSYESGPGTAVMILRFFMLCWFLFHLKSTYEQESSSERKRFYKLVGIGFSGWALTMPATAIGAIFISPWVRYKIIVGMDVSARFLGQAMLLCTLCGPVSPVTKANTFVDDTELCDNHAWGS